MQLTDSQLADIKDDYMTKSKTVRDWIKDNELEESIYPRDIIEQLMVKYTKEVIHSMMRGRRQERELERIPIIITRFTSRQDITVEVCDDIIANLQDALITISAKKAELQG